MVIRLEFAKRARQLALPLLCVSVLAYFLFHTIQGDRGVVAWLMLKQDLRLAETRLTGIESERLMLANRVARLSPKTLDPDLLEEQVRVMLNHASEDEVVIMRDRMPPAPTARETDPNALN